MDLAQLVIGTGSVAFAIAASLFWFRLAENARMGRLFAATALIALSIRGLWLLFLADNPDGGADVIGEIFIAGAGCAILFGMYLWPGNQDLMTWAEQDLKYSEERFKDFAEAASDWFWETDENHRFTYFSERVEEVTGVPVSFHIGKTREELAAGNTDKVDPDWEAHLATLQAHKPFSDFRFLRSGHDGRLQYLSSSGKPVYDADNKFLGYRGIGKDITEEWQYLETQRRMFAAIEVLREGVALYDQDERLLMCNQSYRELSGDIGDKLTPGIKFSDQLDMALESGLIPLEGEEAKRWVEARLKQRENPGLSFEQELADGKWILIRDQRLPQGDMMTMVTDITQSKSIQQALRLGETRLKDFADTAADWFWEQNADLQFTFVSAENSDITGMKAHEHYGKTRRETGIEGVSEKALADHEEQLQRRETFEDFRFSRVGPDGNRRYLSVSGKPFYNDNGTFAGYRGAGRDVTELVNSEKAFREQRDRAQAANRAKTAFLANMSHELRTPLNAIIGFADVIGQEVVGEIENKEYVSYAEHVKHSGLLLLDIINDVLDLAKVDAGELQIIENEIDVASLLESVSEMFPKPSVESSSSATLEPPADELVIRIDERLLRQILFNIVQNAIKFTGEDGKVVFGADVIDDDIVFTVRDNGIGIPQEKLQDIFEPFTQIDEDLSRSHTGTGLGLTIVMRLMDALDGEVEVDSTVDVGTTVKLSFSSDRIIKQGANTVHA